MAVKFKICKKKIFFIFILIAVKNKKYKNRTFYPHSSVQRAPDYASKHDLEPMRDYDDANAAKRVRNRRQINFDRASRAQTTRCSARAASAAPWPTRAASQ